MQLYKTAKLKQVHAVSEAEKRCLPQGSTENPFSFGAGLETGRKGKQRATLQGNVGAKTRPTFV